MAAHRGAVEQRWAETAWTLAVLASLNPFRAKDQTFQMDQFNPLRIAEGNTDKPAVRRRGGLPLDPETIRAYHAVLVKRGKIGKSGERGGVSPQVSGERGGVSPPVSGERGGVSPPVQTPQG